MVEIYLCCRWTSFETPLRSSSTSLRRSAVDRPQCVRSSIESVRNGVEIVGKQVAVSV
jgi:hypothetical protein